jgi:hypothetical protein
MRPSIADTLTLSLDLIQPLLQITPIPALQLVFSTFRNSIELFQQLQSSKSQACALIELEAQITRAVNTKVQSLVDRGQNVPETMYDSIDNFQRCVALFTLWPEGHSRIII